MSLISFSGSCEIEYTVSPTSDNKYFVRQVASMKVAGYASCKCDKTSQKAQAQRFILYF
ncbi:MAG: hypothetical protein GXZ15_05860 [Campylobacter sp.]|nr:hypothetical protein [Campylobacter sp.]